MGLLMARLHTNQGVQSAGIASILHEPMEDSLSA